MEGFASSLYQNLMEKSMKRNGKAFAYLFLAVWSMTSIGCTSSSKEERAVREIPVKTWTVSFREGVYTRSYIGEIEGESSSSLSFQVLGYVECIYVKEGQRVERGELLARLDETTLQSTYDAALSTLKQAEDAYARMEQLHKSGSLPEIKWVEVQSSLQQARSMEQIAKKNLKDVELRAPYSGIIYNPHFQISRESQTKRLNFEPFGKTKRSKIDKRTVQKKHRKNIFLQCFFITLSFGYLTKNH